MRPNHWAVAAAVVAGAVVSSIWYSPLLFGSLWMELRDTAPGVAVHSSMPAWKVLVELVREVVVASVLGRFVLLRGPGDWKGALRIGFCAWLGFPVAMLVGASLWDNKPWMLSAVHGGDWLVKMVVMAAVIGVWRRMPADLAERAPAPLERTARTP